MEFDCALLLNILPKSFVSSQDDNFFYFTEENLKDGTLVLQYTELGIIIWSNEIKALSYEELYSKMHSLYKKDLIIPFIETKEERDAVVKIGGIEFDFLEAFPEEKELCVDYSREFGSFIVKG